MPATTPLPVRTTSFLLYLAICLYFFGTTRGYTTNVFGYGGDSFMFVWCLGWWPWAIAHGLNPFVSDRVWYPHGIDLTWVTSTPMLAFIGLPVTLTGGAILTYNILILLAPVLAAWCAFLLALHLTRDAPAAFVAGYLYGFSAYEIGHLMGHLNLSMTCVVPTLILLGVKHLGGEVSRRRYVVFSMLALLTQFGISIEVFATACLFGAVSWMVFLCLAGAGRRRPMLRLALDFLFALTLMLVIASPFLFFLFRGMHNMPATLTSPGTYSADMLNFLVPSGLMQFGFSYFSPVAAQFTGGLGEQSAFLGLPIILILTACFARNLHFPIMRAMLAMLLLLVVCSLGPRLWISGTQTGLWLPWSWAARMPLIRAALPGRFNLYVSLLAGIVVAFWLAGPAPRMVRGCRFVLAILACLFLWPNRAATSHWASAGMLPFFDRTHIASLIKPNQNILLLPFGAAGSAMIWQWQAGYSFTQSGGGTGTIPASELAEPAVWALSGGPVTAGLGKMILAYCRGHGVTAILAGPGTAPALVAALRGIGWPWFEHDGVTVFIDPAVPGTGS